MQQVEDFGLEEKELKGVLQLRDRVPGATASQLVRFYRARDGVLDDAAKMLEDHLEWRKEYDLFNGKIDLVELEKQLRQCICSRLGEQEDGTSVYLTQVNLMGPHSYDDINVSIAAMVAVFEYAESLWGPLEKFDAAITLKGVGRKNVDMKWIKLMGGFLQNQYPERLKRAYLAPVPLFARALWGVIKLLIDKDTVSKIRLGGSASLYLKNIDNGLLPKYLGGTREADISNEDVIEYIKKKYY